MSWSAAHTGNDQQVSGSEFFVQLPMFPPLWPANPFSPSNPDWFQQSGGQAVVCEQDTGACPEPPEVDFTGGGGSINENDVHVANGGFISSSYGATDDFEGSRTLFGRIKNDLSLLGQDNQVDSFYQANLASNIARFQGITDAIRQSLAIPTAALSTMENNWSMIDSILVEINTIDSLFQFAQNQSDSIVLSNQNIALQNLLAVPVNALSDIIGVLNADQVASADLIHSPM